MKWVQELLKGERLALARVISKLENRDPDVPLLVRSLYPHTGKAQVWGITGPPGAGKSTLVNGLLSQLRAQGKKVAVMAIDPSSPFSGGAILGDRIRMQVHASDRGVFIRSLGTRGKQGGLSLSSKEVVLALDAAGFDVILVETAGVGQTELDILRLAQTVVVVLVPESGDSIQVMKAGLMEIADIFVVNKCDRPQADQLVRELIALAGFVPHDESSWIVPVIQAQGIRNLGVVELEKVIAEHQDFLFQSGKKAQKDLEFLKNEVIDILNERLKKSVFLAFDTSSGQDLLSQLVQRSIDPYQVADLISYS